MSLIEIKLKVKDLAIGLVGAPSHTQIHRSGPLIHTHLYSELYDESTHYLSNYHPQLFINNDLATLIK